MIFNLGVSSTDEQIARLIEAVNESIANIDSKVDELEAAIAGASFNAVKSVQRGMIEAGVVTNKRELYKVTPNGNYSFYIDINLTPVSNVNKCFVYTNEGEASTAYAIPKILNNSTLRIYIGGGTENATQFNAQSAISWQVVEFY